MLSPSLNVESALHPDQRSQKYTDQLSHMLDETVPRNVGVFLQELLRDLRDIRLRDAVQAVDLCGLILCRHLARAMMTLR